MVHEFYIIYVHLCTNLSPHTMYIQVILEHILQKQCFVEVCILLVFNFYW